MSAMAHRLWAVSSNARLNGRFAYLFGRAPNRNIQSFAIHNALGRASHGYTYSISDDKFLPNPLTTTHRNHDKFFLANDITRFAPCSPF
ncbi:MAG: hypothetical protein OT477_17080 [Chloroflexi bacterium]|nr:hypothetical protein [Chloroflexota bacterium]